MKCNYNQTRTLVKNLNNINDDLLQQKQITEEEYNLNVKILYEAISGRLNLTEIHVKIISSTIKQKLNLVKLRICILMLQINFN